MYDSMLIPGLEQRVSSAIASSQRRPENSDLPASFWTELANNLSDSRLYYTAGAGHVEPSYSQLEVLIADSIAEERKRPHEGLLKDQVLPWPLDPKNGQLDQED